MSGWIQAAMQQNTISIVGADNPLTLIKCQQILLSSFLNTKIPSHSPGPNLLFVVWFANLFSSAHLRHDTFSSYTAHPCLSVAQIPSNYLKMSDSMLTAQRPCDL